MDSVDAKIAAPQAAGGTSDGPFAERARGVLTDIVRLIGAPADVVARPEAECVVLDLQGDNGGLLIGRHGQTLDALEYIVNRIVCRDGIDGPRIVVDSNDYRARHRSLLEDLARSKAAEAKRRNRAVHLNPMSSQDRRIIHMFLQEDPSLRTESSGDGYERHVVIVPVHHGGCET